MVLFTLRRADVQHSVSPAGNSHSPHQHQLPMSLDYVGSATELHCPPDVQVLAMRGHFLGNS